GNIWEVQELVGIGAQQAGQVADARVATLICRQCEQIREELPHAQTGAELDRERALRLSPKGMDHRGGNSNVFSRTYEQPLTSAPDEQDSRVDDEPLLLAEVNVRRPTVTLLGGFDVRAPNVGV